MKSIHLAIIKSGGHFDGLLPGFVVSCGSYDSNTVSVSNTLNQPRKLVYVACLFMLAAFSVAGRASDLPAPITLNSGWQLQDIAKVASDGASISKPGFIPKSWYRATVPGTVLTSLVNDGVYPEPLYGENNRPDKIPESLCRTSYWYRTRFTVPNSFAGKHVWLNFDGINYMAEVWVNGHDAGPIKGAFARGVFDVTPYVTVGGSNGLAVQILPLLHPGITHEKTQSTGTGHNGGDTARDGATFLCTIGWDWIPGIRDRDMGIWQKVWLSASGPVVIKDPYVTSDLPLPRTDSADLTLDTTLTNTSSKAQAGVLVGSFGQTSFRDPITLAASETRTVTLTPATTPQLHVLHPLLWWPNGYGPQNLYTLHLRFEANGVASDTVTQNFGIRKITYILPGSDNLAVSVNGVPVVCKGGDWGMDEAMKRIPYKRLDAQIRMHRDANYTIIRNWVGQSTSEDFYDLCDKYGIMLWDEFFQPNPGDGPNPDDNALYMANVREKILRFRSHPSIAIWCGRNEGFPPPDINAGIQKLMDELERGRLYQPSSTSGRGVHSGGPYYWRAPQEFYNFDEPFKTEIGSVSVPTLEAVRGMMPEKDWTQINDDWAEHDFCAGAQGGNDYPHTMATRYGKVTGLEDFVRKAQLMNYEAFRAMYEGRFAKLFNPVTGVITWMSNPAQPSFVWQLYSYDLEPNAALFGTRKACEPIHIMLNQSNWHVMVINNTPRNLDGLTARTSIYNLDGTLQNTQDVPVSAAPSAATDCGLINWPANLSNVHFVRERLLNAHGQILSTNFYWRSQATLNGDGVNDLQGLNDLPRVTLVGKARRHDLNGETIVEITLLNPTKSVALMAHVQLRHRATGLRVLPVFYSDNYISLLPGESRTIQVEAALSDAGSGPLDVAVDGWNDTVAGPKSGQDSVRCIPNADASEVHTFIQKEARSVHCGGGAVGSFEADTEYDGGNVTDSPDPVSTTGVANAGPAALYQTERWAPCTYTIPVHSKLPNKTYTVRLHFAETKFDVAGSRQFNVSINGKRVLNNFDIFAAAGGKNKAVVQEFKGIAPDASGDIVISFAVGSADQPKICGIEVLD